MEPAVCHLKQILVDNKRLALVLQKRFNQGEDFDKLNLLYSLRTHPDGLKKEL